MADISEKEKIEKEKVQAGAQVSPDLGLPKPVDASMHEALKTTVETLRHDQQIEKPAAVEAAPFEKPAEAPVEKPKPAPETKIETQVPTVSAPVQAAPKDEVAERIENILSEGLEEEYKKLPPAIQAEFRQKGEETTGRIKKLLESSKVKVKQVLALILQWLRVIPHVNRYFLEQEAKIKADKIMDITRQNNNG